MVCIYMMWFWVSCKIINKAQLHDDISLLFMFTIFINDLALSQGLMLLRKTQSKCILEISKIKIKNHWGKAINYQNVQDKIPGKLEFECCDFVTRIMAKMHVTWDSTLQIYASLLYVMLSDAKKILTVDKQKWKPPLLFTFECAKIISTTSFSFLSDKTEKKKFRRNKNWWNIVVFARRCKAVQGGARLTILVSVTRVMWKRNQQQIYKTTSSNSNTLAVQHTT